MSVNSPSLRRMQPKPPPTEGQAYLKMVRVIIAVTNPVAALLGIAFAIVLRPALATRVRGWHILTAGIIVTVIGMAAKLLRSYVQPWKDLATHIKTTMIDPAITGGFRSITGFRFPTENLNQWVHDQLPFAFCLALLGAGIYLNWADRYRDKWRKKSVKPASQHRVARAKKTMDAKLDKAAKVVTPNDLTLPIGIDALSAKPVTIPAPALRTHAVVIGPTGVGKTELLQRLIWGITAQPAAANLRIPAIVIDMKGDPKLAAWLEQLATILRRPFHKITTDLASSTGGYLALSSDKPDEIADTIYETVFAGDPNLNQHYATLSRRLLQVVSYTLVDLATSGAPNLAAGRPWRISLPDLASLLSIKELRLAMADTGAEVSKMIARYVANFDDDSNPDVGDVADRIAIITDTQLGKILATPGLILKEAIQDGAIVCFSLDAAASPESARTMGRLAVQDISATFGALAGSSWSGAAGLCPIILDEFSALATPKIADLFARARSAGGAIILSTQDLDADLSSVSEQFAAVVRTNTNVWAVLRQTRADMAESIASDLGTTTAWKETVQIEDDWGPLGGKHSASGVGSLREVEAYALHPNELRDLPPGAALLIVKIPGGTYNQNSVASFRARTHISQAPALPPAPHHTAPLPPEPTDETHETHDTPTTPPTEPPAPAGPFVEQFESWVDTHDEGAMPVPPPPDDDDM